MEEKIVETKNGKIFYYITVASSARPIIVFLHGLSANHTTWLNLMKKIGSFGYGVLAPDLRGHGLSDKSKKKSNYKIAVFTDDLREIIKKENLNEIILVGYSFGGLIALDYAIKYPAAVSGLVLISANYVSPLKYRHLNLLTPFAACFLNLLAVLFLWQKKEKYYYYRHGESKNYWHSVWVGLNTMPLAINFWMLAQTLLANFQKTIYNIKAPTIIVRGEKDLFLTQPEAEKIKISIPKSKIIISKNVGHFLASRSQDEMLEIILDFLKNL